MVNGYRLVRGPHDLSVRQYVKDANTGDIS